MELNNARITLSADDAVARARHFSRYLNRILEADSRLLANVDLGAPYTVSAALVPLAPQHCVTRAELHAKLRTLRQQTMAVLIVRDLAGLADLREVTTTVTQLAELTISAALDWLECDVAQHFGAPRGATDGVAQTLHVVGMGKLGGGELNVSSDIDLVFVYPEEGETHGARTVANHDYFTRLARALITALSEITADGYVFRVDTRLRPYGDSGPLVVSFDMLENYLVTQGREWERYAWIKARVLTGDRGNELMDLVRPFVFRRHLDYSALSSMRELHAQIGREVERREIAGNIKLGPGGIREIEFITQVFQLIRGGRDTALRCQSTLQTLDLLAARNMLPASAVEELTQAYVFLRNLEHRLQYLDDQQTHALPADAEDRLRVAQSMNFADEQSFIAALETHRATVTRHFSEIFAAAPQSEHQLATVWNQSEDAERGTAALTTLKFQRAAELQTRIARMRASPRYRQMPATSQSRLDRLVPLIIEAAASTPSADNTLERLLTFLEAVSRRESYLALLEEYPQARARLAELMHASPWVAEYLTQRPILLDELLDTRTLHSTPDWPAVARALRVALDDAAGDTEKQMDILRHFKHQHTLRLVARDLAGSVTVEVLSDHLSDLAQIVLDESLRLAWQNVKQRHRDVPAFAVIGYGKLGGKELGYASDLDLVFLYDDPAPQAPENYARLAQRLITWLTSVTSAGVLYDTDIRLRPDGAGGLLVSPINSFRDYQRNQAWVWEHQALTRARFVAGDQTIGQAFESIRIEVLRTARAPGPLRTEIAAMRQKMHDGHPNTSGLFDIKHSRGGLIDVEFIVQYLVLGYSHKHAALTGNIGNLALLKLGGKLGLIPDDLADAVHRAYRQLRKLQHGLRLQGERYARIEPEKVAESAAAVRGLWDHVFGKAS